jgi:hypothetical protein
LYAKVEKPLHALTPARVHRGVPEKARTRRKNAGVVFTIQRVTWSNDTLDLKRNAASEERENATMADHGL